MSALRKKDFEMRTTMGRTSPSAALRRGLVAAFAAVVAATGPLPQLAHADTAPSGEVTIPSTFVTAPVGPTVAGAGADGYLLEDEQDFSGVHKRHDVWHPADGGAVHDFGAEAVRMSADGRGTSVMWILADPGQLRVYDAAAASWTTYALPASATGAQFLDIVPTSKGWSLAVLVPVKGATDGASGAALHLYAPDPDGGLSDQPVQGWQSAGVSNSFVATAAVPGRLFLQTAGSSPESVLIDTDKATVTYTGPTGGSLLLSHRDFGWGHRDGTAVLRSVDDPQAAPRNLSVPAGALGNFSMALTDSALIVAGINSPLNTASGRPLYSVPLDGTTPSVLLTAAGAVRTATDGGGLVDAQPAPETWATYKIPADGGPPVVLEPFTTAHPQNVGLSLARGELRRVQVHASDEETGADGTQADVGVAETPEPPATTDRMSRPSLWDDEIPRCGQDRCVELVDGGGATGAAYTWIDPIGHAYMNTSGPSWNTPIGPPGGRIVSASGDLVLYDNSSDGKQYLLSPNTEATHRVRPIVAAALWGDTLWTATTTAGRFTSENTVYGTGARTVTTDAPCVPQELQVLGRWLYWSCSADGPAGVWDSTSGKSVRVPSGHALLGDGFVLRHADGQLLLTDVHAGTAAADRKVADLPAGPYDDDRNITWTVDKYRGFLAYSDAEAATHVVPSGVPQSPIAVLSSTGTTTTANVFTSGWSPQWTTSGPVASWRVDLRRKGTSTIVRTLTGGAARGVVAAVWDGRDPAGRLVANGDYTWTLTLTPANGQGSPAATTGTVPVIGHAGPAHDYTGDGAGDVLALTSTGRLDVRPGTGTAPGGVRATSASGSGWPSTSLLIPTGDLTGDGPSDLLVRDASGHLTRYDGTPGHAFTPSSPHHVIGGGWNIYNSLVSPGDMNNDGWPDLIARDTKGDLFSYASTGAGTFAPPRNIGYGYQVYDTLVGAQNPNAQNGYGYGSEVLARDKAGVLWRYFSDGNMDIVGPGQRVGGGWNVYNAIVGAGDLNGDGRNDLVARDGDGNLWRYDGKGDGTFTPRVKIGWGWQAYKALL
ncbi:FG-GAP-like repeat-containing protein [Streptomyces sp. NPDC051976]|uniref:FG-GAP-like repeat-containing protein n=1 Tax=Streptomyces sp. NPDC051976 TaxID=3154947 RepID=UPI00342AD56E